MNRQAMALQPKALRLQTASQTLPRKMQERLDRSALLLGSLDPALVLERGYAWLENAQGQAIATVQELQTGQEVQARLADGVAAMRVIQSRAT
jgi:exodeoxyribonuclease VII large subunit